MSESATVQPLSDAAVAGLFENFRKLKEFIDNLQGLGIDWSKLGDLGKAVLATLKIVKDTTATVAQKVDAVLDLVEKFASATKLAWDDAIASALRQLEPTLVKIITAIGGAAVAGAAYATANSSVAISALTTEIDALKVDWGKLFGIAMAILDIVKTFL